MKDNYPINMKNLCALLQIVMNKCTQSPQTERNLQHLINTKILCAQKIKKICTHFLEHAGKKIMSIDGGQTDRLNPIYPKDRLLGGGGITMHLQYITTRHAVEEHLLHGSWYMHLLW